MQSSTGKFVHFDDGSANSDGTSSHRKVSGQPIHESLDDRLVILAEARVIGATQARIAEKSCAGADPLVGRLDVRVGAYDCRNFPVEKRLITIFSLVVSACMSTMIVEVSCRSCSPRD